MHRPEARRPTQTGLAGALTDLVERIATLRGELPGRMSKLDAKDAVRVRLARFDADTDAIRKKIVATREGGAITGEERLRERVADLYGSLVFYEGPPATYQLAAIDTLTRELADVRTEFDAFTAKSVPEINRLSAQKKLPPIAIKPGR